MANRTLITLIALIAVLNGLHAADHIVRGDFHWPIDGQSIGFTVVTGTIYIVLGIGLFLYRRNKVGPRFWAIVGMAGLAFGWISHFSPWTDQSVQAIYRAYYSEIAGWLAVACLLALMASILAATLYATYLSAQTAQRLGN